MKIKKENIIAAYNAADDNGKAMLKSLFPNADFTGEDSQNKPVTERIKTFEDAMAVLGENHPLVIQYKEIYDDFLEEGGGGVRDIVAFIKLRIIVTALNEGWEPQFKEYEYRHAPWFDLYTQEEIDKLDEEDRSRVLGRSSHSALAYAGVACSTTNIASSFSTASYGGRLCFKSHELAKYAGEAFLDLWADLMLF